MGGLRRRWLTNTLGVVFSLGLVCVLGVTASYAAYHYPKMHSDPESRATTTPEISTDFVNQNYDEFTQSCITYTETYEKRNTIELQYFDSQRKLVASSYGHWAGDSPSTPEILSAINTRDADAYVGKDPVTGERIIAVSGPVIYSSGEVVGVFRYVTSTRLVDMQIFLVALVSTLVLMLVLGAVLLSSTYCIRSVLNPVDQIIEKAKRNR